MLPQSLGAPVLSTPFRQNIRQEDVLRNMGSDHLHSHVYFSHAPCVGLELSTDKRLVSDHRSSEISVIGDPTDISFKLACVRRRMVEDT